MITASNLHQRTHPHSNSKTLRPEHWGCLLLAAISSLYIVAVPIISLALALLFFMPGNTSNHVKLWPVLALIFTLAIINGQKWPVVDLAEYYSFTDYLAEHSLREVFTDSSPFTSIRPEEFIFIGYAWFLASVTDGSRTLFSIVSTILIYTACGANCSKAVLACEDFSSTRTSKLRAIVICTALLASITFAVTAHLTRQYLAGSLFFFALLAYQPGSRRWPLFVAPLSIFVHSSAAFLLLPLALTVTWSVSRKLGLFSLLVLACLAVIYPIGDQIELLQLTSYFRQDGDIGNVLIILDSLAVLLGAAILLRNAKSEPLVSSSAGILVIFSIAFAVTMANLRDIPFLFFRLYFYFEFCRAPLVALILAFGLSRVGRASGLAAFVVLLGSILVCFVRANSSDWEYTDRSGLPINSLQTTDALDRMSSIEKVAL